MESKALFALCIQLVFMKCTLARCVPAIVPEPYLPVEFCMPNSFTSGLAMQTTMVPAPSFSISSDDLAVEGLVTVFGSLPFLGTVSLAGELPAIGQGNVLYNAGNGEVDIVRETPCAGIMTPILY